MATFLYGWLTAIIIILYHRVIGETQVICEFTNNDYSKVLSVRNMKKENGTIVITCREVRHRVLYRDWNISRVRYMYDVNVMQLTGSVNLNNTKSTYPHFGLAIFRRSKYPHTRAINAHLDNCHSMTQTSAP